MYGKTVYLDNAATSWPKPLMVYRGVDLYSKEICANPSRGAYDMALDASKKIFETRRLVADFFDFDNPKRVVFTKNCTEALNMAIKGVLESGSHVITTRLEHNSVLRPLYQLQKDKNISISFVGDAPFGYIDLAELERKVRKNTRMIIVSAASNVLGTCLPLREIGEITRRKKVIFLVDAAQGAGCMDISMKRMNIDILAFPGHKGLMGPQGSGGLIVNENIDIKPLTQGGTGSDSKNRRQPSTWPEHLESGTLNGPAIFGLQIGIKSIQKIGLPNIHIYKRSLIDLLHGELKAEPDIIIYSPRQNNAGIFSFNIRDMDAGYVGELLNKRYGIAVRTGFHCAPLAHRLIHAYDIGTVRISVGIFNTKAEINYTIKCIKKIIKENRLAD